MLTQNSDALIEEFHRFIGDYDYPCVAARAALSRDQISFLIVDHIGCPKDDRQILDFIYSFVERYRQVPSGLYSAAILFRQPETITEEMFEFFLWQRLQALSGMDAEKYHYDRRVNHDPMASDFSFSLAEEAFFVIGLHPGSSRNARKFKYPALIFNPHAQFEELRNAKRYEKMKKIVRKRDTSYSGSINPMLADFGEASEVFQYSGRQHGEDWTCPLKVIHGTSKNNSTQE